MYFHGKKKKYLSQLNRSIFLKWYLIHIYFLVGSYVKGTMSADLFKTEDEEVELVHLSW